MKTVLFAFIHEGNAAIDHFQELSDLQRFAIQHEGLNGVLVKGGYAMDKFNNAKKLGGSLLHLFTSTGPKTPSSNAGGHDYTGLALNETKARMAIAIQCVQ
jgi:hypothetical protein